MASEVYRQRLTAAKMRSLESEGYCVIDGFFGLERATAFREEIKWLEREQLMKPNQTQFGLGNGEVLVVRKPHIYEVDLHDDAVRAKVPSLDKLFQEDALVDVLNEKEPQLSLVRGKSGKTIKLQYNCGNGGCFPLHYDNPGTLQQCYSNQSIKQARPFVLPPTALHCIGHECFHTDLAGFCSLPTYRYRETEQAQADLPSVSESWLGGRPRR